MIFASLRAATYRVTLKYYPALDWLMSFAIPKSVIKQGVEHYKMSVEKIDRRLNLEKDRPDLVSMIKRDEDGVNGLRYEEMLATSSLLIIAGSETSTTVLSGIVNYITRSPDRMGLLAAEIRETFKNEDEFTLSALKDLPYLNAVLNEGLRLCNPT